MLVAPCMSTSSTPRSASAIPARSATTRTAATSEAPSSSTHTRHPAGTDTVIPVNLPDAPTPAPRGFSRGHSARQRLPRAGGEHADHGIALGARDRQAVALLHGY